MKKVILDLCGGTGSWSEPYAENREEYEVYVITMPEQDVRLFQLPSYRVHGILAAPPCTKFAVSGNRWKKSDTEMIEALSVVDACLRLIFLLRPTFWALENPVGTLQRWLGPPRTYFHPYEYGDAYEKKTALWGNFEMPYRQYDTAPKLYNPLSDALGGNSKDRQVIRSKTPPGFARAFYEANR